jgi:intracellular proteinase inhibitor BsuPI
MRAGPVRFEIEVPPQVPAGQPVPITLRARNTGAKPVDLYLRGREIAFDITVASDKGEVVWRRLAGKTVPAILQVRTLGPGESLELSDTWDQHTSRGMPAGPGGYLVEGEFPGDSKRPRKTPAVTLRVVEAMREGR